jgi:hypothetical protein
LTETFPNNNSLLFKTFCDIQNFLLYSTLFVSFFNLQSFWELIESYTNDFHEVTVFQQSYFYWKEVINCFTRNVILTQKRNANSIEKEHGGQSLTRKREKDKNTIWNFCGSMSVYTELLRNMVLMFCLYVYSLTLLSYDY